MFEVEINDFIRTNLPGTSSVNLFVFSKSCQCAYYLCIRYVMPTVDDVRHSNGERRYVWSRCVARELRIRTSNYCYSYLPQARDVKKKVLNNVSIFRFTPVMVTRARARKTCSGFLKRNISWHITEFGWRPRKNTLWPLGSRGTGERWNEHGHFQRTWVRYCFARETGKPLPTRDPLTAVEKDNAPSIFVRINHWQNIL